MPPTHPRETHPRNPQEEAPWLPPLAAALAGLVAAAAHPPTLDLGWFSPNPVEPGAGGWVPMPPPDPAAFAVPPPPANDSPETREELAELHALAARRTPADIAQIHRWSTEEPSLLTHWSRAAGEAIRRHGLTPPAGARVHYLLAQAVHCAVVACWRAKYRYLRPRPNHLDPTLDVSVIPVPQHPAYPAGHSAVAGAAAGVLGHLFPREAARFAAMAEDSGISRLKAGIHFRSDHTAGMDLGARVAAAVLARAARDGAPTRYLP